VRGEGKAELEVRIHCAECVKAEEIEEKAIRMLGKINMEPREIAVRLVLAPHFRGAAELYALEEMVRAGGFSWLEPVEPAVPALAEGMVQPGEEAGETVLLCRHLRSGQKFHFRGNVVILGDVNPGAEVVAGGNILVLGSLRGLAHAGKYGDQNTVISAYRLNPTQLRISDHITRPPDGEAFTATAPEVARIKDGKVVIEKLKI
jgi:septum site-determining protein MinC